MSRSIRTVFIAIALLVATLAAIVLLLKLNPAEVVVLNESGKLHACRAEALQFLKPERPELGLLTQIADHCYMQVRGENLLGDFNIRRSNYFRQQFQGIVFLWMVVAITMSGVLLAALQLVAAYKLASTGRGSLDQGGEITLEEKRISLKSSVTGLLILTVSLAFFMVFVAWVYPLTDANISVEGPSQSRIQLNVGTGGLGPAPPTSNAP
jgi:hypothetical protein